MHAAGTVSPPAHEPQKHNMLHAGAVRTAAFVRPYSTVMKQSDSTPTPMATSTSGDSSIAHRTQVTRRGAWRAGPCIYNI